MGRKQNYRPVPDSVHTNWILSIPKSGLNFTRYCTEFLTGRVTPGAHRLGGREPGAWSRSHFIYFDNGKVYTGYGPDSNQIRLEISKDAALVILIRNYKELAMRPGNLHTEILRDKDPGKYEKILNHMKAFFQCYEQHQGPKKIIYYEDILDSIDPIVDVITNVFIDLEITQDLNQFKINEDFHRAKSFNIGNPYQSDGKSKKYYQKNISQDALESMDQKAQYILGEYYHHVERYLAAAKFR